MSVAGTHNGRQNVPADARLRRGGPRVKPGRSLLADRYTVTGFAGDGASGNVWHGRENGTGRLVTLYEHYSRDPARHQKLVSACRLAVGIHHPALLTWRACGIDRGEHGPAVWLVADFVESLSLESMIQRGPLETRHGCEVAAAMADGLAYAYSRGLAHGACEPGLVRIVGGQHVKLLGHGLYVGDEEAEAPARFANRRRYRAPELLPSADATAAADQYSVGCIAIKMITGSLPGELAPERCESALRQALGPVATNAAAAIMRSVSEDPRDRFEDLSQLADSLRN